MSFLEAIIARKRDEVAARRQAQPAESLARDAAAAPAPRSLIARLAPFGAPMRVIAEIKRASPSAGAIRAELDAALQAQAYERAGAAAISVLTDGPGFGGSLDDLRACRESVDVPLLRKDFIVDEYQLLEARAAGADAILLIVAALAPSDLQSLLERAGSLGMDALVECHTASELDSALAAGARLVGINNRDLRTFHVDLAIAEGLLRRMPQNVVAVIESGVRSAEDARRLARAGASNVLVGEALVRAADPAALIRAIGGEP